MGRSCFVVSPIGSNGSEVRRKSDCLLEYIVRPAFEKLGFSDVTRVDVADETGMITTRIINRLNDADWVVADLTGSNPNVFYELGIRHALQKPVIHMTTDLSVIPFDIAQQNTIVYLHDDPHSHRQAMERIVEQVTKAEANGEVTPTPFSMALAYNETMHSGSKKDQLLLYLAEKVMSLSDQLNRVQQEMSHNAAVTNVRWNALAQPGLLYPNATGAQNLGLGEQHDGGIGDHSEPTLGDLLSEYLADEARKS